MSDKKQQIQKQVKSNNKYIALAVVIILAAIGIMINNGTEEELANSTVASVKPTPATEQGSSATEELIIARIDISTPLVNVDEPQFEVYVDNSEVSEKQAEWMHNYNIQGCSVQKQDGNEINIKIKALSTADIVISLKGIWDRGEDGNLIKHPITYTVFQINNENILTGPQTVWFAEPYEQSINVKAGDEYTINIKWQKANQ